MHGIQALTTIPDPRRRCGRHSPLVSLLSIVLRAAMHPSTPRKFRGGQHKYSSGTDDKTSDFSYD